ncbi:MAG: cytochrome oxidase putative small subunit CydP [Gammaproteobacteria bacterium]
MERTNPVTNCPRAMQAAPSRGFTLAVEITATLIVKLLFIWALWFFFFSHPLDEQLDDQGVSAALIGARPDIESSAHRDTRP